MNSEGTKFRKAAKEAMGRMGYKLMEWRATCGDWAFGFVESKDGCFGCIAFSTTGQVTIEILKQKEQRSFPAPDLL